MCSLEFPGRVDLGVGRAPGTDQMTAQALRRHLAGGADSFPNDVVELLHYFQPAKPGQPVRAVPGAETVTPPRRASRFARCLPTLPLQGRVRSVVEAAA